MVWEVPVHRRLRMTAASAAGFLDEHPIRMSPGPTGCDASGQRERGSALECRCLRLDGMHYRLCELSQLDVEPLRGTS